MEKRSKRLRQTLVCLLAALTFIVSMATVSFAAEANENVNGARNGVVQVRLLYKGSDKDYELKWGSGFLVNDMTVMTCNHVVTLDDDELVDLRESDFYGPMVSGKTDKQIREKLAVSITVYTDSTLSAEIAEGVSSETADFVALKLKSPLADYKPLPIRDTKTDTVSATEQCYVLGFPYKMVFLKPDTDLRFSQDAVDVTPGSVKRMDNVDGPMNVIMSDLISDGYSGGPMVDGDGNVIGIAKGVDDNQSYAVASEEFLPVLTTLGVEFTPADSAPTEEEQVEEETPAEEVPAPAPEPEPEPEKKTNIIPFVIGGAAVVLLGILAAVLLTRKKKNDAPAPAAATYAAGGPAPVNPATGAGRANAGAAPAVPPIVGGYAGGPTPDTSVLNQGSNETTVLGQGAGETSVLSSVHANGSLTRSKTGEKITITRENFKIGRERSKVDYCISDNTAIGRHHATIISRNGDSYLVDENSRNFTFVNDVKVAPNVETKLNEGDKISFGDEVYTYHTK